MCQPISVDSQRPSECRALELVCWKILLGNIASLRCQILIPEDALGDVFGGEGGFDASCQQMCGSCVCVWCTFCVVCGLCGAQMCVVWTVWCAMHQCNASVRATEYKQLSWDHLSLSLKPQIKKSQNKELGYLKLKLIILCVCAGHATFLNSRGKRLACQNKSHQGRPRSMNCDKFLAASSRGAPPPKMAFSHTSVGTFC